MLQTFFLAPLLLTYIVGKFFEANNSDESIQDFSSSFNNLK